MSSECLQSVFRVSSECLQSVFNIEVISSSSASSVSIFGIFYLGKSHTVKIHLVAPTRERVTKMNIAKGTKDLGVE